MKLILEQKEFDNIYGVVKSLNSSSANEIYNKMFGPGHHPGIKTTKSGGDICIEFDKNISNAMLTLLMKYGISIGSLLQCSGLQLLNQARVLLKTAGPEFKKALQSK